MSLHTRQPAGLLRTAPPAWLYRLVVFAAAWLGFWIQRLRRVTDQLVSIPILLRQRRSVGCFTYPSDRYLWGPLWSAKIHAEWMRNLLMDRPDLTVGILERTRAVMDGHFPEAAVTEYESLAAGTDLPDPGDRHVLAAAIHGQADVIVTLNLRDFPVDRLVPHDLTAQHPDMFIAGLFESRRDAVLAAVRDHRAALRNPLRSAGEHLAALDSLGLVRTASALRACRDAI